MSTTHQARWVRELTGETRYSLITHLLMLIVRLARLTYPVVLLLFLQRREIMTTVQLAVSSSHWRQHTHYHKDTLHPTHQNLPFKLTHSCQLWWAHHQMRFWHENPQRYRLQDNTTCTSNPLHTMTVSYLKLDPLWISLPHFLKEKQETTALIN